MEKYSRLTGVEEKAELLLQLDCLDSMSELTPMPEK